MMRNVTRVMQVTGSSQRRKPLLKVREAESSQASLQSSVDIPIQRSWAGRANHGHGFTLFSVVLEAWWKICGLFHRRPRKFRNGERRVRVEIL